MTLLTEPISTQHPPRPSTQNDTPPHNVLKPEYFQPLFKNLKTLQLEENINTNFNDMSSDSCMDYSTEMDCSMADGCEWMMGMCMETSDDCIDYLSEMDCNMADGCEWMMDMCMELGGGMQMSNNTPHFVAIDDLNGYCL